MSDPGRDQAPTEPPGTRTPARNVTTIVLIAGGLVVLAAIMAYALSR